MKHFYNTSLCLNLIHIEGRLKEYMLSYYLQVVLSFKNKSSPLGDILLLYNQLSDCLLLHYFLLYSALLSLFSLFLMDVPYCYLGLKPVLCVLHSDVNSMYLSSTEPPAAAEWACLLRPLRGREPEGIWNLLSIVREMFKRRDSNAAPLLEILTEQCLTYEQVYHQRDTSSSC